MTTNKRGPILLIVCLAFVSLLGGLVLLRNSVIKFVIEQGVKSATGVRLSIQHMHVGLTSADVDIRGLKLHNPWGFHEDLMMDMPQMGAGIVVGELFKRKVHLTSLRLHMNELVVIKNERGEVNINTLKPVKEGQQRQQAAQPSGPAPRVQIDYLEYTIGKVVFKDYSQGSPPKVQEFPINLTRKYSNVTNPAFIASVILVDAITRTTISRLANVDVSGVQAMISNSLRAGVNSAGSAAQDIVDGLRRLFK